MHKIFLGIHGVGEIGIFEIKYLFAPADYMWLDQRFTTIYHIGYCIKDLETDSTYAVECARVEERDGVGLYHVYGCTYGIDYLIDRANDPRHVSYFDLEKREYTGKF